MKKYYCSLYAIVFMGIGVLSPLIGPYLEELGFSGRQIGIITAAGTLTTIFASPFWGQNYSLIQRRSRRYLMVACVLACAAVIALTLSQVTVFAVFLILYMGLYFFQSPSTALLDAMTIDDGHQFGFIRTFGALGFALACFGAARAADLAGISVIFPIYASCFLAAGALVLLIRSRVDREMGPKSGEEFRNSAREMLRRTSGGRNLLRTARKLASNRSYALIILCAFFINGTDIANNTYFSFLYLEGGGRLAGVGVAFLLMAGSEAPFMAASDRLCERFGQGRILLIAMVFSVVRFGLFALGLPAQILIALFPLQGLVNGITLVEYVKYISRVVPEETRGTAIALYYAICNSLSTILCQLIGGVLLDHGVFAMTGPQSVYLFFALFNVAGVAIFLLSRLHEQ